MTNRYAIAALPALALLAACGQDIAVTNDNNVILNDAYANTAFRNDGGAGNEMIPVGPVMGGNDAVTSAGEAMMSNTVGTEAAQNAMSNTAY